MDSRFIFDQVLINQLVILNCLLVNQDLTDNHREAIEISINTTKKLLKHLSDAEKKDYGF